jgi:type II secretory pathway predicted ATPase ExeA
MKLHEEQSARMRELKTSQRSAAADLGIAPSVLGRYLTVGLITSYLGSGFPDRVDEYLKRKEARLNGPKFGAKRLIGEFYRLKMSLTDVAAMLGMSRTELQRGIYEGDWNEEASAKRVSEWIARQLEAKMFTKVSTPSDVFQFFHATRDPFGEIESAEDRFAIKTTAAAEKKIMHAIEFSEWLAIVGETGSGKTTLLDQCRERFERRKDIVVVTPMLIEKQALKASHVVAAILADLGGERVSARSNLESQARRVVHQLEQANREGKKVVVIVDDAHLLADDALLMLRRFRELKVGARRLVGMVLLGQPSLAKRLRSNYFLNEVALRCDCFVLDGVNGQIGQYIEFRLERAGLNGTSSQIFDKSAIKAIGKIATTPLAVNSICSMALIRAHDLGERIVTGEIIEGFAAHF